MLNRLAAKFLFSFLGKKELRFFLPCTTEALCVYAGL